MMTFSCLSKQEGKLYPFITDNLNITVNFASENLSIHETDLDFISQDPIEAKIKISMALTLTVGLFQVYVFFMLY